MLAEAPSCQVRMAMRAMLRTGLRIGECLALRPADPPDGKMPATNESDAEFEARMRSDLNRVLAEQKALHLQARGLPPPESAVQMRIQAFQEQAEIYRRARKGWIGALSCIPWPIPKSRGAQPAYMGSKWLRFFRVIHHLSKKSTPLETGRS